MTDHNVDPISILPRLRRVDVPVHLKLAWSIEEAAAMVGLSDRTIRKLVADGVIAKVPNTDRLLIARVELARWVNSTSRGAGGDAA